MHSSFSTRKLLPFLIASCTFLKAEAQNNWQDSIRVALKNPKGIYATVHNRNKLFFGEPITLRGLIVGVNFNDKLRVFSGIYGFSNVDEILLINSPRFRQDTVTRFSNTANFSVGIEYTYKQLDKFSLTLPLMIGLGGLDYTFMHNNEQIDYEGYIFIPIEAGTNAYYDFLEWLGVKAGVGYRMAIGNREALRLSAPFYNVGIRFSPFKLYNSLNGN